MSRKAGQSRRSADTAGPSASVIQAPSPETSPGPALRALVVEDNEQTAYLLGFLLERAGYEVVAASNGRDAEALLAGDAAFDIILLDLILPHTDGFHLLMQVREDPRRQHTPVLVLSGKTLESDVVRAFELGADDYVTKPFRPAELVARLDRLGSRKRIATLA